MCVSVAAVVVVGTLPGVAAVVVMGAGEVGDADEEGPGGYFLAGHMSRLPPAGADTAHGEALEPTCDTAHSDRPHTRRLHGLEPSIAHRWSASAYT